MLYPAAVSAAAAAVWLLAVLGLGLSLPAEHSSESDFTLCSDCFYRQTPPQGASAGPLLHPLCHRLPGGQAFATLSRPTCDTAVYSAFHLSHGGTQREEEEGEDLLTGKEEDHIKVGVPALLKGDRDPSHLVSPTESPLQQWDSTVTGLVKSSISPKCSTLGGDIYILLGAGGLGATEDGNECHTTPLWSALCCAYPEGKGGFSVGLIKETGEEERQVSIKEVEEMLGVTQLFFGGCGGGEGETVAIREGLHSKGLSRNTEKIEEDDTNVDSGNAELDTNKDVTERSESCKQSADVDVCSDKADVSRLPQGTTTDASLSSSDDQETGKEEDTDSDSTSTLNFILSTTLSILKAPLRPVFSTITQLPEQVTYVLQEELGVLAALPGNTFDLVHLFTSDILSYMGSAAEMLLGISETCFSSVYYCSSSMLEALLNSCHTGCTGVGTLAGDTVGIFGDALENTWSVTKFFGGRLYEQCEGYVGTVISEMGGQAEAVGQGFGGLVWRSGNGVGNVFRLGEGLIMMMVNVVIGDVKEAFGLESE